MENNEPQDIPPAPVDCKVANKLPAGTAPPYVAIQVDAHDPAAIPLDVKPSRGKTAALARNPPIPIVARQEAKHIVPPKTGNHS